MTSFPLAILTMYVYLREKKVRDITFYIITIRSLANGIPEHES